MAHTQVPHASQSINIIVENKSICWYPFNGAAVRPNGLLTPCCAFDITGNENHYVWSKNLRDDEYWNSIRNRMLSGEKIKECRTCYGMEQIGKKSMRQWKLEDVDPPNENKVYPLESLEVTFSNLCNLACVSCSDFCSSKWATENIKAGRVEKYRVTAESKFDFKNWDLTNLKELIIIGGEPFMEQKRFVELMRQVDLTKCHLRVITNGTHLPNDELKSLIETAKTVRFIVSVDSVGTINDWYRWPSKFDNVLENLDVYTNWWKNNSKIRLTLGTVINAVTIFGLTDFVNFFQKNYPNWAFDPKALTGKSWHAVSALPNSVKAKLIEEFRLAEIVDNGDSMPQHVFDPYQIARSLLEDSNREYSWQDAKKRIMAISVERNLDFLEMVPKFKEFWDLED